VRNDTTLEGSLDSLLTIDQLVDAGFSAQLGSESFVTGQLLVDLDFRPGRRLELYGSRTPYPEIPSVPSDIQEAIDRFQTMVAKIEENVDLGAISDRVLRVLQGLDELVNSQALRDAIAGLDRLMNAEGTRQLPESLKAGIAELRSAGELAARLIHNVDGDVEALVGELAPTAKRLNAALAEAEKTLQALGRQATGDSTQMYQLQATLAEVEEAAQSMRAFFDYLERDPRALLRGKQP